MTKYLFWDSNVFIAHINKEEAHQDFLDDLSTILEHSQIEVYTSGIALAEITPKRISPSRWETFNDFVNSLKQMVNVIDPSPNICTTAGKLKDYRYSKSGSTKRVLTTGDAIMLATAIVLQREPYNIQIEAFHTFDNGRGKGVEGKAVPLLSFEEWVNEDDPPELIQDVIDLNRCKPEIPA